MSNYRGEKPFDRQGYVKRIHEIGTVKSFTCFYDAANFLMTGYYPMSDNIHAIFEFENGDTLQFETLLCGYLGTGPLNTVEVLTEIGIPEKEARYYCCDHRGLRLDLVKNESGGYRVEYADFTCWFDHFQNGGTVLDSGFSVSTVRRTVVVPNPEERFGDLCKLIEYCVPFSMEYSTDPASPLYSERDLHDGGLLFGRRRAKEETNANVIISGDKFCIYACFGRKNLLSMLNTLSFFLRGEVLFYECRFGRFFFLSEKPAHDVTLWKLLRLIRKGGIRQIHGQVPVERREWRF